MVVDPEPGISPHLIFLTGSVVTWWGRIEWLLTSDLQNLISKHEELRALKEFDLIQIASKRRIKQWVRAHRRVYDGRSTVLEEVEAIAGEARDILEDRNVLIHGMWHVFGQNDPRSVTVSHMSHPKEGADTIISKYVITEAQIDEINKRAYDLYHRLVQLSMNLTFSFGGSVEWSIKGKDA